MDTLFQVWGGLFYLLAKIFLSRAEGGKNGLNWRLWGWIVYLIGVPAWLIILSIDEKWIALAVEAGGIPSMMLGVNSSTKNPKVISSFIKNLVKIFIGGLIIFGILCSINKFDGINKLSQALEMGVMIGFLIGTYLLSQKNHNGWLFFALMNISMGTLMLLQKDRLIFTVSQLISIYFVIDGYLKAKLIFRSKEN